MLKWFKFRYAIFWVTASVKLLLCLVAIGSFVVYNLYSIENIKFSYNAGPKKLIQKNVTFIVFRTFNLHRFSNKIDHQNILCSRMNDSIILILKCLGLFLS